MIARQVEECNKKPRMPVVGCRRLPCSAVVSLGAASRDGRVEVDHALLRKCHSEAFRLWRRAGRRIDDYLPRSQRRDLGAQRNRNHIQVR